MKGRDHLRDLGVDWTDNNRNYLKETGCAEVNWIQLAHDRMQYFTE
jgi:hypothetical protein